MNRTNPTLRKISSKTVNRHDSTPRNKSELCNQWSLLFQSTGILYATRSTHFFIFVGMCMKLSQSYCCFWPRLRFAIYPTKISDLIKKKYLLIHENIEWNKTYRTDQFNDPILHELLYLHLMLKPDLSKREMSLYLYHLDKCHYFIVISNMKNVMTKTIQSIYSMKNCCQNHVYRIDLLILVRSVHILQKHSEQTSTIPFLGFIFGFEVRTRGNVK